MNIFNIIMSLLGGESGASGLVKAVMDKDTIKQVINKMDRQDIELLFIVYLASKTNDPSVVKQALDIVGKIALNTKTVVISDDGECG